MAACVLLCGTSVLHAQQHVPPLDGEGLDLSAVTVRLPEDVPLEIREAEKAGDYQELERLLLEQTTRQPDSAGLLAALGEVSFRNGSYLNTAIAYKRSDALTPLNEANRFTLAMAYVVLGRSDWARPELSKLATATPERALYHYWLGRLDYDDQRYSEALARFRRAIALDPGFARSHDRIGLCHEALGQFDEAVTAHKRAVELNRNENPPSAWLPMNLGALLLRMDRVEEAESYLFEAIEYDASLSLAHYQVGKALSMRGQLREAVLHLERAAQLDPKDPQPHYALGRIHLQLGDRSKARSALAKFKALEAQDDSRPDRQ